MIDYANKWTVFLTVVLLGAIILSGVPNMLPPPNPRDKCFMPIAINQAAGRGLVNNCLSMDPQGHDRLVWHGFLYPLVCGSLLWKSTYPALLLFRALLAIGVLVCTAVFFHDIESRLKLTPSFATVAVKNLLLMGLVPPLLSGRPEPFATLLFMAGVVILMRIPRRYHWVVIGCNLALLATAHPAMAVLSAILCGIYFCCIFSWVRACWALTRTAIVAIIGTVLIAEVVYPYGLADWLWGMHYHLTVAFHYWGTRIFYFWFRYPTNFAYGFWYLMALLVALAYCRRYIGSVGWPIGVLVFSVMLLVVSWRLGIWVSARNYNLIAFAPCVCGLILAAAGSLGSRATDAGWKRRLAVGTVILIAGLPSIGMVRMVLHTYASQECGVSYREAKAVLDELRSKHPEVAVAGNLFVLAEDQRNLSLVELGMINLAARNALTGSSYWAYKRRGNWPEIFVLPQSHSRMWEPPKVPGFTLIEDRFSRRLPKFLGIPTGFVPDSYNFAVYRKKTSRPQ